MQLLPSTRIDLGEGAFAFPQPPTLCLRSDGSALCVVSPRTSTGWQTSLVHVRSSGEQTRIPLPEGTFGAQPVIVDRGESGVVVLVDDRTAVMVDDTFSSSRTVEILDGARSPRRDGQLTAGGIARPTQNGHWMVILTDPATFQNARTIAEFRIGETSPLCEAVEMLDGNDYPMAGGRTSTAPGGAKAPIIGDVITVEGTRFVAAQGSDAASMLKYGSDFFTLAELDAEAHVTRRLYEERDWKKQPGKHGIRARFTSDGTSAILTPVFRTGSWAGRQHLIRLADGSLEQIPSIRGASAFALADLRGDRAVLVSDDEVLFADLSA